MGMKCDQCAPGFTGTNCDTSLPNHFGHNCVPCLCEHGTCVVSEDGDDHIVHCKCENEWYGPTCKTHLLLGPNLIADANFTSLQTPGSGPWYVFKDGYVLYYIFYDYLILTRYSGVLNWKPTAYG